MTEIRRLKVGQRMSQAVEFAGVVWLAGQCGTPGASVAEQTAEALAKIEALLLESGSDKTRILQAIIWLSDIETYGELNSVWDAWIPEGFAPARSCGETKIAGTGYDVEITVVAAKEL